jgi:hypothetical protein
VVSLHTKSLKNKAMGLVQEKVKLQKLKSDYNSAKTAYDNKVSDCAWCKKQGTSLLGNVYAPNGLWCATTQTACNTQVMQMQGNKVRQFPAKISAQELIVLAEETKNDVFLKEQEILQQTFETDTGEQEVAQALAKAKQELEILKLQAAKASSAQRLAEKGDMQSARALLGVQEAEGSWKKPVIISGIIILALGVGFGIYKIVK